MRVFRATYTANGRTREAASWYVELRDVREVVRRVAGFTDKGATVEFGRKLERLVSLQAAGMS